jgi:hypothetical protein
MPVNFNCPECGIALVLKDEMAGRRGICTACQGVIVAPESDSYDLEDKPEPATSVPQSLLDLIVDDSPVDKPVTGNSSRFHYNRMSLLRAAMCLLAVACSTGIYFGISAILASRSAKPKVSAIAKGVPPTITPAPIAVPAKNNPPKNSKPTNRNKRVPSPAPAQPLPAGPTLSTEQIIAQCEGSVGVVRGPTSSGDPRGRSRQAARSGGEAGIHSSRQVARH